MARILGIGTSTPEPERFVTVLGSRRVISIKIYDDTLRALQGVVVNQQAINQAIAFNKAAKTPADICVFGIDETGSMWEQGQELHTLATRLPRIFERTDLEKTAFSQIAAFSIQEQPFDAMDVIRSLRTNAIRPLMDLTPARNAGQIPQLRPNGGTPLLDATYALLYSGLKTAQSFKKAKRGPRRLIVTVITDGQHTDGIIVPDDVRALAEYIRKEGFNLEFNLFAVQKIEDEAVIQEQTEFAGSLGGAFAHGDINAVLGLVLKSALARREDFLREYGAPSVSMPELASEFVDRHVEATPGDTTSTEEA